jgi:hypothetical protein
VGDLTILPPGFFARRYHVCNSEINGKILDMDEQTTPARKKGIARFFHICWLLIDYGFNACVDALGSYVAVIRREVELFLGVMLSILGIMSFDADKFCDGNTADYLSCTRPTAYYYFDTWDKVLVVVGVVLIMIWFVRRK